MFKPQIHYSRSKSITRVQRAQTIITMLFVLFVALVGLKELYVQAKAEGAAEYKAQCISNYQQGYLTVRTQCQPGYRSK